MFTFISTNANFSQALSISRHLISKLEEVFWGDTDVCRSPLRHLLKSNATPSDSEVIAIRALISDAEASIEELHRHFPARNYTSQLIESQLPDYASQLIESQLLKSIEEHRALLSPVRYLPSEILEEIFLHYAADGPHFIRIGTMPWRLGHICHRWRKIAVSLSSLWDTIPIIHLPESVPKQSYLRAMICLLQRSGTAPTLKIDIRYDPLPEKGPPSDSSIIKEIMLHSERIEQLRVEVNNTTMPLFRVFKGRIPNLRILRVHLNMTHSYDSDDIPKFDVFEDAPALRQVTLGGSLRLKNSSGFRILLPWSQITHFEEKSKDGTVGLSAPLSSLHSLTYFDIVKSPSRSYHDKSATPLSPYRPTTLPNLRTLRVKIIHDNYKKVDLFLESLSIPAVEVMRISCMGPLIPRLISMFSGSHGPSRLQKLGFSTIPLQTGELSALLRLTPHLVELDISVPPTADLLRLIYGDSDGEVMLVPILQALYIRIPLLTEGAQIEYLDTLAQVRCELESSKDSDDANIPSLAPGAQTWTTLHTLRLVFGTSESRDTSQKILNKWSSSYTLEEAKAINMFSLWCTPGYFYTERFVKNLLSYIEYNEITNKVLLEHIEGQYYWIRVLRRLPDEDKEDKLKQRVMDVLAEWGQLLLNEFSGGGWARTCPESCHCDSSLVYVSKSKFHEMRMSADGGLSIVYGLKLPFEDWSLTPKELEPYLLRN